MKWFINMKINKKLLVSFILMAFIIGVVGVFGIVDLNKVNKNVYSMHKDGVGPIILLSKVEKNFLLAATEMQRIIWKSQALKDTTVIDTSLANIEKLAQESDLLIGEYKTYNLMDKEKEFVNSYEEHTKKYREIRSQAIEVARQSNYILAVQLNDQASLERDKIQEIIQSMKDQAQIHANNLKVSSDKIYEASLLISMVLTGIGMIFAVFFSVAIGRIISRPIMASVGHARLLAQGDFSTDVPAVFLARKDEIGSLAKAFDDISINLRELIKQILSTAQDMSASSEELSASAEEVTAQGQSVNSASQEIVAGMEETSASTEEVKASGEEIEKGSIQLFKIQSFFFSAFNNSVTKGMFRSLFC
jgi:methyl-accepting chemotaxis protein